MLPAHLRLPNIVAPTPGVVRPRNIARAVRLEPPRDAPQGGAAAGGAPAPGVIRSRNIARAVRLEPPRDAPQGGAAAGGAPAPGVIRSRNIARAVRLEPPREAAQAAAAAGGDGGAAAARAQAQAQWAARAEVAAARAREEEAAAKLRQRAMVINQVDPEELRRQEYQRNRLAAMRQRIENRRRNNRNINDEPINLPATLGALAALAAGVYYTGIGGLAWWSISTWGGWVSIGLLTCAAVGFSEAAREARGNWGGARKSRRKTKKQRGGNQLQMRNIRNRTRNTSVKYENTIEGVKEKLARREALPPDQVPLVFGGVSSQQYDTNQLESIKKELESVNTHEKAILLHQYFVQFAPEDIQRVLFADVLSSMFMPKEFLNTIVETLNSKQYSEASSMLQKETAQLFEILEKKGAKISLKDLHTTMDLLVESLYKLGSPTKIYDALRKISSILLSADETKLQSLVKTLKNRDPLNSL